MPCTLPQLLWQCSDIAANLPGIRLWLDEARLPNLPPPLTLDVDQPWPPGRYDAVYTANTLHIMGWPQVRALFAGLPQVLRPQGLLILVSPGPGHLQTLKQSLYAEPRDHEAPAPPAGFDCVQEHLLRIQLTLRTQAEIDALLTMTPFLWTARRRTANNLSNLTHLATQAEFLIRCYQPAVV